MFTGIVQHVGRIVRLEHRRGDLRLVVDAAGFDFGDVRVGDSIAVSGVCLTVAAREGAALAFDVSNETLGCTTLGTLGAGHGVNLEPALRLADRLGGHLVAGHVDAVGEVASIAPDARAQRWRFTLPAALRRYVAPKGSIAVDGVSLTVNGVDTGGFDVALIPHTLAVTTFGERKPGDRVNLEVDLIARYVERLREP